MRKKQKITVPVYALLVAIFAWTRLDFFEKKVKERAANGLVKILKSGASSLIS